MKPLCSIRDFHRHVMRETFAYSTRLDNKQLEKQRPSKALKILESTIVCISLLMGFVYMFTRLEEIFK